MALTLGDNFSYQGAKPLDARLKYSTVAEMKAVGDSTMYDGCLAYCSATEKTYQWKSTNSVDETLGRWREFETGGGSSEDPNAYHTTDSAETSIWDTNYFPFLDGNTPKKSLWSNIKSVLKTYFDTLYDLNKDDIVKYAECSTGASTTAKTANVSRGSFKLVVGSKVAVRFSYANTATSPTLNINSTGAKEIKAINSSGTYVEPTNWNSQDIVTFIYNGAYYIMQPSFGTLPSLPVVGTITRAELYSTTEKVVGMWTDGRPLYQKTINFGALPNATEKNVAHGISNLNYIVDLYGIAYQSSNGKYQYLNRSSISTSDETIVLNATTTNVTIVTARDRSGFTAYITIRYTKTTDSANSYNYANENDYSTSEKIVGTWIDGSYLYQITKTGTTSSSGSSTSVLSLNKNYFVRKFEGTVRQDTGVYVQMGYTNVIDPGTYTEAQKDAIFAYTENGYVKIMHGEYNRGKPYSLTIQYTK